MVDKGGILDRR